MRKRHIIAFICILTILTSMFTVLAEATGVSGIICTKSGSKIILRWSSNPQNLDKNVVHIIKNGEELTPITVGTGRSAEITPVANGDEFVFTVRSHFKDQTTADVIYSYFVSYNNTTAIPDWTVTISGKNGEFGITTEEAQDSLFSAYLKWEEAPDEGRYNLISKRMAFTKDVKYRISYWFKAVDYTSGDSFTYSDGFSSEKEFKAGEDFKNGEWKYNEKIIDCTESIFNDLKFKVYSKGTLYIDNFKVETLDSYQNTQSTILNSTFEKDLSAKDFTVKADGKAVMSWTNPTDPEFLYNEIYETNNDVKKLIATLKDGETSYSAPISVTGGIRYTLRSCYAGGLWGETHVEKWISASDSAIMPGWTLDLRDKDVYNYRGEYEITTEETHTGDYAAKFSLNHGYESMVYTTLYRDFTPIPEKRYCVSYWFKTKDYVKDTSFQYKDFETNQMTSVKVGNEEYPNGEWNNFKHYFETSSSASKRIMIYIMYYGTIFFDDIEVYEVDENGEKIGENLLVATENATDGGFEYSGFEEKPAKPSECVAENKFRGALVSWKNDNFADKIRIYEGETLLFEGSFQLGEVQIKDLSYGSHKLDICSVSRYGVESDKVSVEVSTLASEIGEVVLSKNKISSGKLTARVKVSNDSGVLDAALVLALYKGDVLEKIEFANEAVKANEDKTLSVFVEIPSTNTEEYSVAAYVWDKFFGVKKTYTAPKWLGGQNE